jgi:hypothetical protein
MKGTIILTDWADCEVRIHGNWLTWAESWEDHDDLLPAMR